MDIRTHSVFMSHGGLKELVSAYTMKIHAKKVNITFSTRNRYHTLIHGSRITVANVDVTIFV